MKKLLLILVSLALVLSFAGCSQGEETPTDVSSVADVQTAAPQSQEAGEIKVDTTVEASVESKPQKTESVAVSGESEKTVVSTPVSNDKNEQENMIVEEDLEFSTEAQLKNWFKNQTQVENAVSAEALQTMQQGNTITYLRPGISSSNELVSLDKIIVELSTINYHYRFGEAETSELFIAAHTIDFDQAFYNGFETNLNKGKENYFRTTVNGIEYLYMRNVSSDSAVFVWKQNDVVHSALLYGHYDQINEILPLLKLETVTVQTQDDLVTQ